MAYSQIISAIIKSRSNPGTITIKPKLIVRSPLTMLKRKLSAVIGGTGDVAPVDGTAKLPKSNPKNQPEPSTGNTSKYFNTEPHTHTQSQSFEQKFLNIQLELNSKLKCLNFKPPVAFIYNPVEYAFKPNESYVRKYCRGPKEILYVGMNPGPFGMCQTGVPFGEIKSVRDWLAIDEPVGKPDLECPKRPVTGFACTRTEVSGDRFWNLLKKICVTPENFFRTSFVYNYCPLAFMKSDGCNVTPRDMKDQDCKNLEEICDVYFYRIIELLHPDIIVGIGEYAEKRARSVLAKNRNDFIRVLRIPHPSPRAVNNQNWAEKAENFLKQNDLMRFYETR